MAEVSFETALAAFVAAARDVQTIHAKSDMAESIRTIKKCSADLLDLADAVLAINGLDTTLQCRKVGTDGS